MVLAAVGRARRIAERDTDFDGRLGFWLFVVREPAQRSSRRQPAGTLVTREISLTKTTYREQIITNLLPAILARCPGGRCVSPDVNVLDLGLYAAIQAR